VLILLALTIAVLIKHIVIFLAITVAVYQWNPRRAILALILISCIFALTFIPYLPNGVEGIWNNVIRYTSHGRYAVYGFSRLFSLPFATVLMWSVLLVLPWICRYRYRFDLMRALLIIALAQMVFSYSMIAYYAAIVVPFALILRNLRWFAGFAAICTALSIIEALPEAISIYSNASNVLWIYCAVWLMVLLTRREEMSANAVPIG
jgi:hypothetical protein